MEKMKRNTQVAAGVLFLLKHFSFYLFVESLKKANSRNGKEQIVLLLQPGFSLSPFPLISFTPWPGLPSSSNSVSLLPSLVLVPSFLFLTLKSLSLFSCSLNSLVFLFHPFYSSSLSLRPSSYSSSFSSSNPSFPPSTPFIC